MTLTPKPHGFELRLRYGAGKRDRFLLATQDETLARALEPRMEAMARKLATQPDAGRALLLLREAALSASDPKKFATVERVVEKLCVEAAAVSPPAVASAPFTFAAVVELWTSGKLYELDPDRVKPQNERSRRQTVGYLAPFLPVLGSKAFPEITDALIQQAKARIPKGLDPDSRRLYLSRLRSVFRYAVKPLKLIATVPEEIADLPRVKKRNLFWFLYPDEEARLLGCTAIPLAYRVLYGWLSRNGGRITETSKLDHGHLDLERGRVRIEASWAKTGRARFWDLEEDVLLAMRAWSVLDGSPTGEARVFHVPTRKSFSPWTVLDRLHSDLLLAGIDRAELHVTTRGSRRLRSHDFRTGFCTLARRRGMPDTWIMDRSGHESVAQLEQYTKLARHADEQGLPVWWASMHEAIPELRAALAAGVGQAWAKHSLPSQKRLPSRINQVSITESGTEENQGKMPSKPTSVTAKTPLVPTSGPASFKGVGQNLQSGPPSVEVHASPMSTPVAGDVGNIGPLVAHSESVSAESPVERALAAGLSVALAAEQWELAQTIVQELGERRRARTAPSVPSLSDARRKKDEGK